MNKEQLSHIEETPAFDEIDFQEDGRSWNDVGIAAYESTFLDALRLDAAGYHNKVSKNAVVDFINGNFRGQPQLLGDPDILSWYIPTDEMMKELADYCERHNINISDILMFRKVR